MKNRIIALILVLALMLPFEAAFAKVSESKVPELLQTLDIIPSAESVKDETITRGEFAKLSAKLITINNYQNLVTPSKFKDVTEEDDFYHEVNLLQQMGIIHGESDSEFRPNDPIELNDACKILIHIMGYQHFATNGNYLAVAAQRGLLSGISVEGSNFSYKTALKLIYNVLEADISDYNSIDGMSSNDYSEIFMTKRLDIYKIKATVTDDSVISLTGDSKIKDGYIMVGGDLFKNETGRNDLLGYTIEGFYKKDIETEENVMVYAFVKEDESVVVTLTGDDVKSYANHTYTYYPDPEYDETEELFVDPNYKLIYNGKVFKAEDALPSFTLTIDQMMKPEVGQVKLTDTDNDNIYEIVSILDLDSYIISSMDYENFKIYGKSGVTPGTVDFSAAKSDLNVVSPTGIKTEFSKIMAGDVISVGFSADGGHAEVIIANEKVTGTIQAKDGNCYIIGDKEYELAPEYVTYIASAGEPELGTNVDFLLTYEGKIIFAEKAGELGVVYARITGLKGNLNDFNPQLSLQLYLENNSYDYYDFAKTVIIDGNRYKNDLAGIYNYLFVANDFSATGEYYGIVLVKFNADDEIYYIDTPYKESVGNPNTLTEGDDTLHILKNGEKKVSRYLHKYFTLFGNWVATSNSKFVILGDVTTEPEKDMKFTSMATTDASNINNSFLEMMAFSTKSGTNTADLVIRIVERFSGNVATQDAQWHVLLKVTDALNKKGESIKKITVTNGKVIKDYYTETDTALVCKCGSAYCEATPLVAEPGDIIKFILSNNVVLDGGVFVAYDYSEDQQWAYCSETKHLDVAGVPKKQTTGASRCTSYAVLSGYLNTLDFETAEWMIDYLPYFTAETYRGVQYTGGPYTDVPLVNNMRDAYTIEVNVNKGTMRPKLNSEIKQYDNGLGIKERVFLLQQNLSPYCIVKYVQ